MQFWLSNLHILTALNDRVLLVGQAEIKQTKGKEKLNSGFVKMKTRPMKTKGEKEPITVLKSLNKHVK